MDIESIQLDFEGSILEGCDLEWCELYEWVRCTRRDKKLSISTFLKSCNLDAGVDYDRRLVSPSGRSSRPQTRSGTQGKLLRQRLAFMKAQHTFQIIKSNRDIDFKSAIADWGLDNQTYLKANSIKCLSTDSNMRLTVHKLLEYNLRHENLLNMIWNDYNVSANFSRPSVTMVSVTCHS